MCVLELSIVSCYLRIVTVTSALFLGFVNCCSPTSTAAGAMEHGQKMVLATVIQRILENLSAFLELTLFLNLLQNWRSSLCVSTLMPKHGLHPSLVDTSRLYTGQR